MTLRVFDNIALDGFGRLAELARIESSSDAKVEEKAKPADAEVKAEAKTEEAKAEAPPANDIPF